MQSAISSYEGMEETLGWGLPIPTFPLNTDGIDYAGRNGTFRRLKITNFDDTVVPKPSHRGDMFTNCTEDIWVEDVDVKYGVGMSIGSVPPNANHACIRNVTFKNIRFEDPIKGVYVKTNPGTGSGEITDITYQDITMNRPIWWAVYIGPQQ